MNGYPYSKIVQKDISIDGLISAIESLENVAESPEFWSNIANNIDYSPAHRRICIFQLCRRHLRSGMNLSEFVTALDAQWLPRKNFHLIDHIRGKLPFTISAEESGFVIWPMLPTGNVSAIYVKTVDHRFTEQEFFNYLKFKEEVYLIGEVVILEIALVEFEK